MVVYDHGGRTVRFNGGAERMFGYRAAEIGVAAWIAGETVEDLLRRADRALYTAKAAGRNRVVLAR